MQNKTKRIVMITILILIILAISILIINKTKQMPQNINEVAQAQYTTKIGEQEIDITNAVADTANTPVISAGMIPVKWDGNFWVITTTDDEDWYDYGNGQPAYIMLNDGTYQSELVRDMTNKELAEDNIGMQVSENKRGSIYMWIPRFAYNAQGEVVNIKQCCRVAGSWSMPDMFMHETDKRDFSLAGVWVEYNSLASTSAVTTKVSSMNKEENTYSFIANTKSIAMTQANLTAIQKYSVGAGLASALQESTNINRTILKITNENQPEPIKASAKYVNGKVEITVTYRTHAISKILDEDGNVLSENSTTADTGDSPIGNGIYKYIIIDNKGNLKEISIKLTGLNIYVIKDEATLKTFRNDVNAGLTNSSTKAYQVADVYLNNGKYTVNATTGVSTFSGAEQWTPIGNKSIVFSGTYYGGNHTISGLYISGSKSYQGLFGYVTGTVQDLGLINGQILGYEYVGGIAGYVKGRINHCYNKTAVTSSNSVRGTGGIAGHLTGTITKCYNEGNITGERRVGGIAGNSEGTITKCYNKGNIKGTSMEAGGIAGETRTITDCYNLGRVTGPWRNGGIGGSVGAYIITNCYNYGIVTATSNTAGGIAGMTSYRTKIINCYNLAQITGGYSRRYSVWRE